MRSHILFFFLTSTLLCGASGCKKDQPAEIKYGDPVGIELSGEGLIGAVAGESGHTVGAAAVPELATALLAASKACPDLKPSVASGKIVSIHANVADGTLHAPLEEKMDAVSTCVAKAIEGKSVKQLESTKLLVQIASKESK